ncbi:hypothetical protein [Thalassobellus suaedae]|uniref:PH domain-containing protein n=1 Tax=Thalassobellus suaedae TaxID=3074124 RepID=A0ABY9Y0X0_9FLAO|nr:hypothetical protein RHP49_12715 [Flavobacteriaceae bacterium HL-DH10]
MDRIKFEVKSAFKFTSYIKTTLLFIGLTCFITAFVYQGYDVLYFLGFITLFIALLFFLFSSKEQLQISQDLIAFNSKSLAKEFDKSISIPFKDIKKSYFLKRQFLIFGGRSPIADADAQRLYNENRIVFLLEDNKSETIFQVGKLKDFKKAYNIIENRINELAKF